MSEELIFKIKSKKAVASVIGLGYVGLPLAVEFAKGGLTVFGIDVSKEKVSILKSGRSYVIDVSDKDVEELVNEGKFIPTTDFSCLSKADTVNICVPTPLRKTKEPDISYVVSAAKEIEKYIHRGQLVILESTTYPGTTDEVLLPMFEEAGLKVGVDFYLAFSPERVDPSNKVYNTKNIPKVVGGITPACTGAAKVLYETSVERVVEVSSPKTAEMVKLLENTFRSVNIGLVNELCLMSDKLGIDVWEVIDAAATKPFGFMPFYPGPGLGGHCIPIDPFYLSWKARINGFEPRFIELAGEINRFMPSYVVSKIQDILNEDKKAVNGAKIFILGVAYKKDVDDMRESPAIEVMEILLKKHAELSYYDPYVANLKAGGFEFKNTELSSVNAADYDMFVILTDHSNVDYSVLNDKDVLVLDTRNALKDANISSRIFKI